jgi:hypothetical protein
VELVGKDKMVRQEQVLVLDMVGEVAHQKMRQRDVTEEMEALEAEVVAVAVVERTLVEMEEMGVLEWHGYGRGFRKEFFSC